MPQPTPVLAQASLQLLTEMQTHVREQIANSEEAELMLLYTLLAPLKPVRKQAEHTKSVRYKEKRQNEVRAAKLSEADKVAEEEWQAFSSKRQQLDNDPDLAAIEKVLLAPKDFADAITQLHAYADCLPWQEGHLYRDKQCVDPVEFNISTLFPYILEYCRAKNDWTLAKTAVESGHQLPLLTKSCVVASLLRPDLASPKTNHAEALEFLRESISYEELFRVFEEYMSRPGDLNYFITGCTDLSSLDSILTMLNKHCPLRFKRTLLEQGRHGSACQTIFNLQGDRLLQILDIYVKHGLVPSQIVIKQDPRQEISLMEYLIKIVPLSEQKELFEYLFEIGFEYLIGSLSLYNKINAYYSSSKLDDETASSVAAKLQKYLQDRLINRLMSSESSTRQALINIERENIEAKRSHMRSLHTQVRNSRDQSKILSEEQACRTENESQESLHNQTYTHLLSSLVNWKKAIDEENVERENLLRLYSPLRKAAIDCSIQHTTEASLLARLHSKHMEISKSFFISSDDKDAKLSALQVTIQTLKKGAPYSHRDSAVILNAIENARASSNTASIIKQTYDYLTTFYPEIIPMPALAADTSGRPAVTGEVLFGSELDDDYCIIDNNGNFSDSLQKK